MIRRSIMWFFVTFIAIMFVLWFVNAWYGFAPDTEPQEVWNGCVSARDEIYGFPCSDISRGTEDN
jgi:hypothetical protein